jgi:hypothetical protein
VTGSDCAAPVKAQAYALEVLANLLGSTHLRFKLKSTPPDVSMPGCSRSSGSSRVARPCILTPLCVYPRQSPNPVVLPTFIEALLRLGDQGSSGRSEEWLMAWLALRPALLSLLATFPELMGAVDKEQALEVLFRPVLDLLDPAAADHPPAPLRLRVAALPAVAQVCQPPHPPRLVRNGADGVI